jgi:hypothetical protein
MDEVMREKYERVKTYRRRVDEIGEPKAKLELTLQDGYLRDFVVETLRAQGWTVEPPA